MVRALLTSAMFLSVFAVGCSGGAPDGNAPDGGRATPAETFEVMKKAAENKDWTTLHSCMTPESQEAMLGNLAVMGYSFVGGDKGKEFSAILIERGVDMESFQRDYPDWNERQQAFKKAIASVKNKPACIGALFSWLQQHSNDGKKGASMSFRTGEILSGKTLADLTIEGDLASGKITGDDGAPLVLHFKRINDRWYNDMIEDVKAHSRG